MREAQDIGGNTVGGNTAGGNTTVEHASTETEHVMPGPWHVCEDMIRLRAYYISLETGGADPVRDWLQAEAEYAAESGASPEPRADEFLPPRQTPHENSLNENGERLAPPLRLIK